MVRTARKKSKIGIYHIILKGINRLGYVILALSIACGVMVACTCAIIDTIKNYKG